MNLDLKRAKQTIRAFIQAQWSDQKLADVYAFNQDGNMDFIDSCGCLLGVTGSTVLHKCYELCQDGNGDHYQTTRQDVPNAVRAELAYSQLGHIGITPSLWPDNSRTRQQRLSAILRAEIRRRDRASRPAERTQEPISGSLVTA